LIRHLITQATRMVACGQEEERLMALKSIYRNDGLAEIGRYNVTQSQAEEVVDTVRRKWVYLRNAGYAGDYPVEVMRTPKNGGGAAEEVEVLELFRWRSELARDEAETDDGYLEFQQSLAVLAQESPEARRYTQSIRGFSNAFPSVGGMELLRGVCACLLTVDGYLDKYKLSVKNGIVLMHRSPGMIIGDDSERSMLLRIMFHGGVIPRVGDLGAVRVEQNFDRPNDGIVRSHGTGTDFPATAIWRVHWRIQTGIGSLITDPEKPLVFGPAIATHYPPVGTEFHSSTGPVDLIHEESGNRVGTLEPRRLTAFDIVVTKDDEVFDPVLNTPADDLMSVLKGKIQEAGENITLHQEQEDDEEFEDVYSSL
jgi:hypothetical protein